MTGECRAVAVGVTIVSPVDERLMYFPKTFVQVLRTKMFSRVSRREPRAVRTMFTSR